MSEKKAERTGIHRVLERTRVYATLQTGIGRSGTAQHLRDAYFPGLGSSISRVLDIGCGPAQFLTNYGTSASFTYVGFDPNPAYIKTGHENFPLAELHVGTTTSVADEITGEFDLAVAFGVLHHVDDDEAGRITQFAHDRLAPGGTFMTIDPVLIDRQNPIARLLAKADRGKYVRGLDAYSRLVIAGFGGEPVQGDVLSNLLRVPYNHAVVIAHRR
ncbi:MAG: class I SAM-dependent methyltransferase [Actinomycetota bacterium]|nr:class I SAM-dependent methyltransferase [Actinomycetota bacterium]